MANNNDSHSMHFMWFLFFVLFRIFYFVSCIAFYVVFVRRTIISFVHWQCNATQLKQTRHKPVQESELDLLRISVKSTGICESFVLKTYMNVVVVIVSRSSGSVFCFCGSDKRFAESKQSSTFNVLHSLTHSSIAIATQKQIQAHNV